MKGVIETLLVTVILIGTVSIVCRVFVKRYYHID